MKNLLLSAFIFVGLFTTKAQTCSTCNYPGWSNYQKIIINNLTNTVTLSNFQVKLTINTQTLISQSVMKPDGSDIRFSSLCSGGTNYNYWIESGINTATTQIWVKVPSIAALSVDTMYLHFGNAAAVAAANGSLTFDYFDDFTAGTLTGWTFSGGTWAVTNLAGNNVLTCTNPAAGNGFAALYNTSLGMTSYYVDVKTNVNNAAVYGGPLFEHNDFNNYFAYHAMVDMQNTMQSLISGGTANYSISDPATLAINSWYPWSMKRTPTVIDVNFNSVFVRTVTPTFSDGAGVWAYGGGAGNVNFDDLRVRKYSAVTPTISTGIRYVTTPTILSLTSNTAICFGNSTVLTASGLNTYTWNTSSNSPSISVSPTLTTVYSVVGTNTLLLCSNTKSVSVTVNALPSVSVSGVSAICNTQGANLTASGASSYSWSTGALTTTILVTPSVTVSYTVIGTNTVTGCSNTFVKSLTVNPLPNVTISGNTPICIGQSLILTAGGANNYTWTPSNATTTTISASPTVTAMYMVSGVDLNGCSGMAMQNVTVNPLPILSVNNGSVCLGQSFTLTPSGATTYTYSSGSPIVSPTVTSSYSVTGTDANGCVSSSSAISNVTVNALPILSVNSGTICSGNSFTLNPTGALTYTYSSGGPVVSPTTTSSYSVTGTDLNGCTSSASAVSSVSVNPLPVLNITSSNTMICLGDSATLNVTGASTFTWSTGSNSLSINVTPTVTATYTVSGTDNNGCVNNSVITQSVSLCTGINTVAKSNQNKFIAYPNPTNGKLVIELDSDSRIVIMNSLGEIIVSEMNKAGKLELNLENNSNGIYLIKAISNNEQKTIRIIKQ